jgi:DNA replication protein
MEVNQLKNFINKKIVDFSELILENYHLLGIDETDAIILIKLYKLLENDITFINPKTLSESLSVSALTTSKRISGLIDKGFIELELVKGKNGKEFEKYNLDLIFEKIIMNDYHERNGETLHKSNEKELVELFESEFKKPLGVLDIQTITKWLNDDKYTFSQIKDALFIAVKARKLSIKYVDGILLKEGEETPKVYKKTNLMRDFHKLWEK